MQYLILAVILAAAVVLVVDSWRQRRARLHAFDLYAVLKERSADRPTVSGPDIGATLAGAPARLDIWERLDALVNPETFRPDLADGVEMRLFAMRWGNDYGIVARPDHKLHFELQPWEMALTAQLDGTRTAQELVVEHLQSTGDLDPGAVLGLVTALREGGFLDPARPDVQGFVTEHLERASAARRRLRRFARDLEIGWEGAERFVVSMYRGGFRFFFTKPAVIAASVVAVVGLACFVAIERSGRYQLSTTQAPGETLIFLALGLFLTFSHELGHAMTLVHFDRRVVGAGFLIYFGSPAFYIDASDGLMMEPNKRMVQSFAGPFAELVLAGLASLVIIAVPDTGTAAFLYRFALINYFVIFLNLIPLLELDGYWIFSDLIQMPDLRKRSLAFIQGDLWYKLRHRERFSLQEIGIGLYGTLGIVFTIFSFYTAYFFWQRIFGGLVSSLWSGGLGTRVLLVALAFVFIGPLIRGGIALARAMYRRAREVVARLQFRRERSWRIEAAALIDALPAFEDLQEDLLSDLAGRVEMVTVHDRQAVFRRGDEADAFYVIRSGTVRIEDEDVDEGDTIVLTTLHRGDAFGELGLLGSAPRSATARAEGDVALFRVDKAAFDRLLADAIAAPEFAPTMQAFAELRSLPPFRALSTGDLALVLDHGSWVTPSPGETVINQGDIGDAFYAIGTGHADVIRDNEVIADLGPGQHFGEIALLTDAPRNATVRAHTPMRVFRLDREGFSRVVASTFRRGSIDRTPDRNMEH
jgi:CRP-like cAMP-binding protein/Zn-dependent protease